MTMPTKPSYQCQAEPQHRQAGLRGDGHGHLVGDLEAAGAVELLAVEEQAGQAAQLGAGRRVARWARKG